eukprot:1390902-Pyramimonas_sp.AAC.1
MFLRCIDEELAGPLKIHHDNGVSDRGQLVLGQVYDSIGWQRLGRAALILNCPAEVLRLEVMQCMSPRCLRQAGAYSEPFSPWRSIIQGQRDGARVAKCTTYQIMHRLTAAHI